MIVKIKLSLALMIMMLFSSLSAAESSLKQISETGIKHSFLVTGNKTWLVGEDNKIEWEGPGGSRDGYVLPNGNILIAFKNNVREFKKDKSVVWQYKLQAPNKEMNTAIRLANGNTLVTELGPKPRLLEITKDGEIAVEVALQPETTNTHMQTRMARKLPNGNYLVPHLLAFAIKEYDPTGKVVRTIKTDLQELGGRKARNWPFTAIQLANGNIVANLTNGNKIAEFSPDGKLVWMADNNTTGKKFADPCGGQVLKNGNKIAANHAARKIGDKIVEVDASGKVVWEFQAKGLSTHGIHIITTNGEKETDYLR
jgi:hypothetical protein